VEVIRFIAAMTSAGARGGPAHAQRFDGDPAIAARGASEFLYAPFELATQREAIARLRRLVQPEAPARPKRARRRLFQLEARLRRVHARHADGVFTAAADREAHSAGRLRSHRRHHRFLSEAEPQLFAGRRAAARRASGPGAVEFAHRELRRRGHSAGSPAAPYAEPVDRARLRVLIEHARHLYDWVILDLPAIFNRTSLMAISECERRFWFPRRSCPACT
jgi:pilus assembly protein CpaE